MSQLEAEARSLVFKIELEAIAQVKEPGYEMLYDHATKLILDFLASHTAQESRGEELKKAVVQAAGLSDVSFDLESGIYHTADASFVPVPEPLLSVLRSLTLPSTEPPVPQTVNVEEESNEA